MTAFNVVLGCVMALLVILFTTSAIARYYIKPADCVSDADPVRDVVDEFSRCLQDIINAAHHSAPMLDEFVIFVVAALVFASAPLPLMLFRPFNPKNALIPAALLRWTARLLLGIRFEVRGLEHIDNSRGTVVLLNHQSSLDLYVLAVLWPLMARCTVIAKRSMQYLVPFGTASWMWGTVFIDRGSRSAHDALRVQATAVKDEKRKLLLFPEGTRHSGDKLLPFRKGAFHVAMDAAAPVQPVVASKYHFLDDKRHRFGSGEVIVTILPMVETTGMTKDDLPALIEKTQMVMQDTFTRTSAETLARRSSRKHVD